jgi:hypothetical protein
MAQTHVAKNSSPLKRPQVRSVQRHRLVASRVAILPPGTYTDPGQPGLQLRIRANRFASVLSQLFRWGIHRRIVEDSQFGRRLETSIANSPT